MTRLARPGGSPPTPRSVDVARLADVSQKTVSRVLNDEPYVSADVRRRVLDAAEELDSPSFVLVMQLQQTDAEALLLPAGSSRSSCLPRGGAGRR